VLGALLFALVVLYGVLRLKSIEQSLEELPRLRVGVVQAAVPARLRWDSAARAPILEKLRRLTVESEGRAAELTIWPEAAYPHVLPHTASVAPSDSRSIVGYGVRGPVLFGLITSGSAGEHYNAATIVTRGGELEEPQAKLQLLWFGETVPLADQLPFLRRIFFRTGGLVPGEAVVLLRHAGARIGVLNCYEDTLPAIGRRMALSGANLLVNVTNDAWFGPTSEPELHLRLSALRAVETRLDLVRAVNLGVPAWIDAAGVVRARGSDASESVMLATPALNDMSPTLYTRAGDIPVWTLLALAILTGAFHARRSRSRPPPFGTTEPNQTRY
jgi:apolipoprotein N-acyltransferase